MIPKRTIDPNRVKELQNEIISEGKEPNLQGILSAKGAILDEIDKKTK